jgi:hypothetical protein
MKNLKKRKAFNSKIISYLNGGADVSFLPCVIQLDAHYIKAPSELIGE